MLSRKNPYIVSIGYIVTTQQSLEYIPSRKVQPLAKEPIEIDNALIVTEDVAIIPAVETESCVLGVIPSTEGYYLKINKDTRILASRYDKLTISQRGKSIEVAYQFLTTSGYKITFIPNNTILFTITIFWKIRLAGSSCGQGRNYPYTRAAQFRTFSWKLYLEK